MGRILSATIVAGWLVCAGWTAVSRAAEPLAIVSAVKGKVQVVQAPSKKPKAASFGLALMRGDKVTVGRGGSATLFFSDGNVIELGEQSSVTVNERVDKPGKAEIASEVFTQVSGYVTAGSRQTGLGAASSMRGKEEGPFLLGPRRTSLLDGRPTFTWHRVPGAKRYVVKLSTEEKALWTRETSDTVLAYPSDMAPLPADMGILWEVEARSDAGRLRNESTDLQILSSADRDEVLGRVRGIDASLGDESAAAHFLAGSYLSARGLNEEAIDRFAALCRVMPDDPEAHQALARAYASVGLLDQSNAEWERFSALSGTR